MSDKTIIRVSKNSNNPYVMIDKRFLSDIYLSWKAKGILAYLLSKPDNWKVRRTDLIKQSKDGDKSVRAALKELQQLGYIGKQQTRDSSGKITGFEYLVYEIPYNQVDSTIGLKTACGKSTCGKQATTNNEYTNNNFTDYNNNGVEPEVSTRPVFKENEILQIISYYFQKYNDYFITKCHPRLKKVQEDRIYQELLLASREYGLSYEDWREVINRHFERNITTDYNINHFATNGIIQNLMYEVLL